VKLMIAEDDKLLRNFLKDILKQEFDEIVEIERFVDLKNVTISDVDVAIVDLGLPPNTNSYEEGIKVVEYIKNSSNAEIIILTGQEKEEAEIESIGLGVFDYLKKPVDVSEIIKTVKKAVFFKEKKDKSEKISINIIVDKREDFKSVKEKVEKKYLEKLLSLYNNNISKLARELNIAREKVYYYLKKFNLTL